MDNRDQLGKREITCFKAYDVRGLVPDQLDGRVARALYSFLDR